MKKRQKCFQQDLAVGWDKVSNLAFPFSLPSMVHGPSMNVPSSINVTIYFFPPIPSHPFLSIALLCYPALFHSTLYPVPFYPPVSLYPNLLFSILIVLLILRCFFSSYSVPSHHTLFLLILHCSFSSYIVPSHPTVQ